MKCEKCNGTGKYKNTNGQCYDCHGTGEMAHVATDIVTFQGKAYAIGDMVEFTTTASKNARGSIIAWEKDVLQKVGSYIPLHKVWMQVRNTETMQISGWRPLWRSITLKKINQLPL